MNVSIIGSRGFIGKNLKLKLQENNIKFFEITKATKNSKFEKYCLMSDIIFHVAGQNLSSNKNDFKKNNVLLTQRLCNILKFSKNKTKIIYLSTIKINEKTDYGFSKKKAEEILLEASLKSKIDLKILRLPNVYGKWCKPNYNSFITTIFYNVPRSIKLKKIELKNKIKLIHIDKVTNYLLKLAYKNTKKKIIDLKPEKIITIRELINKIHKIWVCHKSGYLFNFSSDFEKNLFSTFLTYLPYKNFYRSIRKFEDKRGLFSEILKSNNFGQISIFTINPGQIRGQHYHNIKNEKFILLSGKIVFRMKNLQNNKVILKKIEDKIITEIISVPGWMHELKNVGKSKAIILLWTNEIYDKKNPDTHLKLL